MPDSPTQAQIYQSAVDFKDALIARDQKASERIVKTYARAFNRMTGNIDALVKRIEQARAAGQYVSPAWAFQLDRYLTLQRQISEEIGRISREVESITISQQAAAVSQSVSDAAKLATMAADNAGVSVSFATLPKSATESIVGFLADGSPLSKLTSRLPGQAAAAIADALTDGITMGWGAEKTARRMRDALGGNMNRALNIARTETMRAYREANYRTLNQNRDILQGWVWVASFSRRTCASCIAMAGTVHPMDERMESHSRCRCSQSPLLRGQAVEFQKGEEWFATQPEEIQRAILGSNVALQAYRDGKANLTDFVGRQNSPEWGRPYYQISTKKAILKQGQFPGYNHPAEIVPIETLFATKPVNPSTTISVTPPTRKPRRKKASPDAPSATIPIPTQRNYKEFPKLPFGQTRVDVAKYAENAYPFDQLTSQITGDELRSVQEYTRTFYRDVNQYLRGKKPDRYSVDQLKERIRNLDNVLAKTSIAEDTLLFRGVHMPRFHELMKSKDLIGNVWQDRGYLSTTMDPEIAERFIKGQPEPVLIRIKANKGQPGTYISHAERPLKTKSYHNGEGEVLLPRNTMLLITDAKYVKIDKKKVLEVEAEIWTQEMAATRKAKIVD